MDVAIDIETMGLNPWEDRAVTVALAANDGTEVCFDANGDEAELLDNVEGYMRKTKIDLLAGWNQTEFDLPFLAVRMVLNGIDMPPYLRPAGWRGKYGKPIYNGTWYGAAFRDVAYAYEAEAKAAGVKWSLKPFAEYKGLGKGIEVDFSQNTIMDLDREARMRYCLSDAKLALALHELEPATKIKGQAVMFDGKTTFL